MGDWPNTEVLQRLQGYGVVASSDAIALTVAGAVNTKSAWTELIASTPFDSFGIVVQGGMVNIGSFDIGVGAAGYEQIIIPDFYQGFRLSGLKTMYFPIAIPAGSRIAARYQSVQTAIVPKMNVFSCQGDVNRTFSQIVTYGFVSGTSRCLIVDPGTTLNTKGTWNEIVASTVKDIKAIAIIIGDGGISRGNTQIDWLIDIGIGAAGYENVFIPDWWARYNYSSSAIPIEPANSNWFWLPIPAGSRLAIRAQCKITTVTSRNIDVILHAIV